MKANEKIPEVICIEHRDIDRRDVNKSDHEVERRHMKDQKKSLHSIIGLY